MSCSVEACEGRAYARGYCNTHYQRWKRLGTHELPVRGNTECLAAGCDAPPYSLRLCLTHYQRLTRHGALTDPRPTLVERFLSAYRVTEAGCWLWTGHVGGNGYGSLSVDGEQVYAHRLAHALFLGPIPDGLTIDHLCRNRTCVNPTHLEPVTRAENTRRQMAALKMERSA